MNKTVLGVNAPNKNCTDKKCPFHGEISVKNEIFKGRIVKRDTNRSATIEWNRSFYLPKYERYEVRRSRMRVHNPPCIDAKIGEEVMAVRTRPLSKTKNHVILQVTGAALNIAKGVDSAEEIAARAAHNKLKSKKSRDEDSP